MARANADIAELLIKPEAELFAMLGEELSEAAATPSAGEAESLGRSWWQRRRQAIASVVCANRHIRELASAPPDRLDRAMLAALVADAILGAVTDVSPLVVAVIVVRGGIRTLCADSITAEKPGS